MEKNEDPELNPYQIIMLLHLGGFLIFLTAATHKAVTKRCISETMCSIETAPLFCLTDSSLISIDVCCLDGLGMVLAFYHKL